MSCYDSVRSGPPPCRRLRERARAPGWRPCGPRRGSPRVPGRRAPAGRRRRSARADPSSARTSHRPGSPRAAPGLDRALRRRLLLVGAAEQHPAALLHEPRVQVVEGAGQVGEPWSCPTWQTSSGGSSERSTCIAYSEPPLGVVSTQGSSARSAAAHGVSLRSGRLPPCGEARPPPAPRAAIRRRGSTPPPGCAWTPPRGEPRELAAAPSGVAAERASTPRRRAARTARAARRQAVQSTVAAARSPRVGARQPEGDEPDVGRGVRHPLREPAAATGTSRNGASSRRSSGSIAVPSSMPGDLRSGGVEVGVEVEGRAVARGVPPAAGAVGARRVERVVPRVVGHPPPACGPGSSVTACGSARPGSRRPSAQVEHARRTPADRLVLPRLGELEQRPSARGCRRAGGPRPGSARAARSARARRWRRRGRRARRPGRRVRRSPATWTPPDG